MYSCSWVFQKLLKMKASAKCILFLKSTIMRLVIVIGEHCGLVSFPVQLTKTNEVDVWKKIKIQL